MASFDEYRKKMNSKYGNKKEEDEKEKKEKSTSKSESSKPSNSQSNTKSNNGSAFDSYRSKMDRKFKPATSVNEDYINSFMYEAERFLNSAESDYKRMGYGTSSDIHNTRLKKATDLQKRGFAISQYLDENKDYIDEETFNGFKSFLDEFDKVSGQLRYEFYKADNSSSAEREMANSEQGKQGWEKYLADEESYRQEAIQRADERTWWEKFTDFILEASAMAGASGDTSLPMGTMSTTINHLREDESYRRPNDNWSEEQKRIFGYLYMDNPLKAYKYAEETNNSINKAAEEEALKKIAESATSGFWAGAGHTLGAIASAPMGMADLLNDLAMVSAGREIAPDGNVSPFEYSQAVTGGITEHLNDKSGVLGEDIPIIGGKGVGDIYGLGTSIAQSMASAYTLGSAGTLISYFGQGAASGVDEALSRGATEGQAVLYGTALGVFEGLFEMVGVDNLFRLGSSSTVKGFIKNILNQAGAEGMEEGLTSLFSNIADNVIMQDKSNFNFLVAQYMAQGMSESEAKKKAWWDSVEGIAFDTIAGAASGGVSGGIHTTAQSIASNMEAKKMYGNGADLVTEALDIAPNNAFAQKMQARLDDGKSISGHQLNRLVETNEQSLKSQDTAKMKSAVEARLTELGETGDVGKLADIIVKAQSGETLTRSERAVLTESKYGRRVSTEMNPKSIESGEYTSKWAENIGTERINTEAYNKGLYDLASEQAGITAEEGKPSVTKNTASKEIATESDLEVSEDGKTRIGDTEVTIKEIASIKDGVMTLRLEDGSTVNASDVEYGSSEEGLLYENVVHMGLNAATANAFINSYEGNMPVAEYALDFRQAYRYGELGIPKIEMNSERFASRLSASVKDLAYNHGAIDAKYKASEKQSQKAKIASTVTINAEQNANKGTKKGKLHNTLKPTSELQRTSLKTLGVLAEALNIDIYTFESAKNAKGQRIGSNGWYDPRDNSLHLDLYAGQDGRGTMLFTAAHELTHHIREKLPAKFKAFADFLFEQYGEKGVAVSELIARKIDHLEKNGRTEGLTESQIYDLAYEEVVADACESFLADGDAVAKIAELKTKDKTLWQTIKDFLTKLVARIKAAYEGLSPDSVEGRLVAEMLDSAEKLKAMWTEMLVEASGIDNAVAEVIEVDAKPISNDEIITDGAVRTFRNAVKKRTNAVITEQVGGTNLGVKNGPVSLTEIKVMFYRLNSNAEIGQFASKVFDTAEKLGVNIRFVNQTFSSKKVAGDNLGDMVEYKTSYFNDTAYSDQTKAKTILHELLHACTIYVLDANKYHMGNVYYAGKTKNYENISNAATRLNRIYEEIKNDPAFEGKYGIKNVKEMVAELANEDFVGLLKEKNLWEKIVEWICNLFGFTRGTSAYDNARLCVDYILDNPEVSEYKEYAKRMRGGARRHGYDVFGSTVSEDGGVMYSDRILMGSLFSGGGTLEAGLVYQMLDKEFAVEYNDKIASTYTDNHGKEHMFVGDVRDFNSKEKQNVFYLHASPVCKNFSPASHSGGETTLDITTAQATARVLEEQMPQVFTVENVKRYIGSEAYNIITNKLDELGYTWDVGVYKASDYGNATKRERMIIRAVKSGQLPAKPQKASEITSWGEATRDLWETDLIPSTLVRSKIEAIKNTPSLKGVKLTKLDKPLLIYDTTKAKTITYAWADELAPTLTTKCGDARIIMPNGRVYAPTPKFMGRIQGLPDDYKYPKSTTRAFTIIGNGIPTQLTKAVIGGVLDSAYEQTHDGQKLYSDRTSYAPTFYSHMGKVIDNIKLEKMGTSSILNHLKNRGVKADEIKWSGIEAFLEGKKSVTKAELQEFVVGSQLTIEEEMSGLNQEAYDELEALWVKYVGVSLSQTFSDDFDLPLTEDNMADVFDDMEKEGYDVPPFEIQRRMLELAKEAGNEGRWSKYKLPGGTNYRELVFKMPNSSYSNTAMKAHWGQDAEGVLAHARIQDMTTSDGKRMLFIEEIQSDWHNEGHKSGYESNIGKASEELQELKRQKEKLVEWWDAHEKAYDSFLDEYWGGTVSNEEYEAEKLKYFNEVLDFRTKEQELDRKLKEATSIVERAIPDAPFRDNYHEYVIKRLLRMVAEEGYDSIGWTTADIQSERWSDEYAEGYRIEYDQDIPKFLRKYGKRWGATVGKESLPGMKAKTTLFDVNRELKYDSEKEWKADVKEWLRDGGFTVRQANATKFIREGEYLVAYDYEGHESDRARVTTIDNQVWSMDITDTMTESVLYEGQVMYSDRNTASFNGKPFWSGSVSLLDGVIEEVHTMEEAEAVDYHHSLYFSPEQVEKMDNEESAFFFVENGIVQGDWRVSVPDSIIEKIKEQIKISPAVVEAREFSDADIKYSIREEAPPKKTKEGYKVFVVKNGKLYPPMVANPNAEDTPVGVWLNADVGARAPDSKTGRMQVKAGGKGTQGGSGSLAFRPGWHLGETPLATQFDRTNPETGVKELFPENFVWALCDIAADHDYQEEAMSYGYTKNGKFQHSLAGLPKLPTDGYYKYRTNPNPDTVPWLITGAMKVKRLLSDAEVNAILKAKGIAPKQRVGGEKTLADLGLSEYEGKVFSDRNPDSVSNRSLLANALESVAQNDIEKKKLEEYKSKIALIESEQAKLSEVRAKIKELSFATGARDTEALKKLQFEANQTANRINTYDRQLLNLEATTALKGVLEREKQMAYKRAEQKGREALKMQREKDRERNAKTQRELMARYQESRKKGVEGRHKTEMRYKIKSVVNELNQYLLNGSKDKHVPIELQKAVAEALDAVNMDTVGAEERIAKKRAEMMVAKTPEAIEKLAKEIRHIEEMGGNMAKKISRLKTSYDSIINSDDPLIANSHDEVISNTIDKVMEVVGETPLRDMSLYQLEAVYDMYRMVLTSIRNANKAFKAQKSEEISVIANRVMEEIDHLGKKKLYRNKVDQFASKFDWNNLKPVYAFERIGSDTFTEVFNNVRAGEDTWAVDITEAKEFSAEQHKKYKYDSWDFKKRYRFTSTSGMTFELSLDQIMSLYAYSKREQAKDHLKRGGIVFDETTEVTVKTKLGIPVKYNPTQATAYNLSDETLADIISKLTTEQKDFVDAMQDYLSTTMGDKGNEVSLALYGVKLYKEKNYFPLKSATQFMAKAKEQQKGEVKIKNSGFSKETKPKASNPIVLTPFMDVWADHVNEMSMYHAFVLALEDFYRVFNYKTPTSETMATESVEMYLQNAFGKAATQYIDQLLKDLNGGARVDSTVGVINKLTGLFKKSAVFASASVVVQQPSAIARATALVDTKYFVGKPSKHKETWAEVKKYAPVAIIKEMGYFDTGMGQSTIEWLKGEKTLGDKIDDVASKAPALADEYAWCAIWNAVKRETLHTHKKLRPNSEEFLKAVGERFTEVIVKTQVYDSVLARSANMRSKDTGMKMATAFMGEPTTSLNMLENSLIQGKRGNTRYARKAIGSVVASMILNSILVSIVYAGRDDDEDKTYAEKYLSTLTEEMLDSLNPLTLIPFVKDIVSIAQGYDVERSDMAVITDIMKAWKNLGNDNRSAYRKVEDFAGAIASLLGLPVKNIMRDARAMYNTVNSFINGEKTTGAGIKDAVTEAITGDAKSNGQQLYEAMVSGDTAQIERVKGRFKDQKAIDSAIRSALRENDSRIKEAAVARYNGDIGEYMRIAKAIIGEGIFRQDDVVAAINSEINSLKKGEGTTESTAPSKATSIYTMDDYYAALVGRDQATAYVVKEDLIKTDVANGKDRDEAEADFNSKFASHIREAYEDGDISDYEARNMLVNYGGKSEEDAYSKVQYWEFKKKYPDYDLSEEAVKKYYNEVEPSGIDVGVYYDYTKQRAKCKGTDSDGDGKTDSGSVKSEVLYVIDSLPITSRQKDVLYYLNGWAASTLWEAPWH